MSSCLQGVKKQTFDCQAVGVACVEQILQEKMQISSSACPNSGSAYKRNIKMSSIRALTENTYRKHSEIAASHVRLDPFLTF
jgi:hypothetical protein